jgi:putative transposase
VLDDFNREGRGIEVDFSLPAERVIRSLDRIIEWRGKPATIRVDNGPEYISKKLMRWASSHGVTIQHTNPASRNRTPTSTARQRFASKPQEGERYNRTVRQEWLDQYIFDRIEPYCDERQSPSGQWEAQDHATQWLWTYTNDRPNIPLTVCSQTVAGQRGIGGITPPMKLKMAA